MRRLSRTILWTIAVAQASVAAEPPSPRWCGSRDRDLGDGFQLNQYMFGGAREFSLTFDVPSNAIQARGVELAASPIRLLFTGIDGPEPQPTIGFANFDVRERDGRRFDLKTVRFDCGAGQILSVTLGATYPPDPPAAPISFMSPFFVQRARIPACFEALQANGRFTLSFARDEASPPALVLHGRLPLRTKLQAARRLWGADMARARNGHCRIMPPPPPPF